MARAVPVTVRIPPDLLARVDTVADDLATQTGLSVSRTDAVLMLIRRGLEVVEAAPKKP
jgi:hypothetical protein